MTQRKKLGRALFYTRDSGGKHETTPTEYVCWANRTVEELGVEFDGTPEAIAAMIDDGQSVCGDLFLDFGIPGNILSRKGLDALIDTAVNALAAWRSRVWSSVNGRPTPLYAQRSARVG